VPLNDRVFLFYINICGKQDLPDGLVLLRAGDYHDEEHTQVDEQGRQDKDGE